MSEPRDVRKVIEDYALESVPQHQRKSGWQLMWMTTGLITTLVQLLIGSYVTALAGVGYGLLAGALVGVFGGTLGWLVGRMALAEGLSSTVLSRFYGLGARSSFVASAIYSFMILGFLALENALLYNGTIFALGLKDSLGTRVAIYGVLTLGWIYLTTYGVKQVLRVSSILTISFLILLVYVIWHAGVASGQPLGQILTQGAVIPGMGSASDRFYAALVALAGSAGALALNDADFARYARTSKDVAIMAFAAALAVDGIMVVAGTIIIYGGTGDVVAYLTRHAMAPADQALHMANSMAQNNTGAYFIIFAGGIGFLLMYAAQVKAQVLNTYSGSLSLSNLFDALFHWRPGRLVMVVLGNLIGLAMTAGGILGLLQAWLGVLGILTTTFVGVILADFYVVRQGARAARQQVESYNAAGLITVAAATVAAYRLQTHGTGVLRLGFLTALVLSVILYPLLRWTILKPGVLSGGPVPPSLSLSEGETHEA
jgi:cytosine permease